ncbi:MAG: hypothetical protein ACOYKA_00055 [Legionellaceae bacterium]
MSLNEQKNKYRALEDWFKTNQGSAASAAFVACLSSYIEWFSGTNVLQLGACHDNAWLESMPFRRSWVLTPCRGSEGSNLVASPFALPFDRNSMDCILAPFTMEAMGLEKNPLDELDRVIRPMGHIVFWGINPMSLWGLGLRTRTLDMFGQAPTSLMSAFVLKQALLKRGFRQCALDTFYYIPPFKQQAWIEHFEFLNEMGKMMVFFPAAFYCLIVQKYQEAPLRIERPRKVSLPPQKIILQAGVNWRR